MDIKNIIKALEENEELMKFMEWAAMLQEEQMKEAVKILDNMYKESLVANG